MNIIVPELEGMEVVIDDKTPADVRATILGNPTHCAVCHLQLSLPYVWIVFEKPTQPNDFFVHPNCVEVLKATQFFKPS
jgi:hypothetical protein